MTTFEKVFIHIMHRIVWLIVVTVIANLILEFSGVVAQTSDSNNAILPLPAAQTQLGGQTNAGDVTRNTINNEVENVRPTESTTRTIRPTRPQRSQLFDNIFKIPIATLQAVNDLLQGITGNFGSG